MHIGVRYYVVPIVIRYLKYVPTPNTDVIVFHFTKFLFKKK